eukprot:1787772-Prorocentrum_lima.AAC.1
MTSSLVGSEMCIRDRRMKVVVTIGHDSRTSSTFTPTRMRDLHSRNQQPVSYTHLTLPTICSV